MHGFFEAFGAEIDDGLADLGDGDFGRGLVAGKAFGAAGEVECEFVAEFAFLNALLVFEPVAVAAVFFPGGDVVGSEGKEKVRVSRVGCGGGIGVVLRIACCVID